MKHNWKITAIIILMFLLTQFVGLYVVNHYSSVKIIDGEKVIVDSPKLPYGLDNPQVEKETILNVLIQADLISRQDESFLISRKGEKFLRALGQGNT